MDRLVKIIAISDSSFIGASLVLIIGLISYLVYQCAFVNISNNIEYDIYKRRYTDNAISNLIKLVILLSVLLVSLFAFIIGLSSFFYNSKSAYDKGINDMAVIAEENMNSAFGNKETREMVVDTINNINNAKLEENIFYKNTDKYIEYGNKFTEGLDKYLSVYMKPTY